MIASIATQPLISEGTFFFELILWDKSLQIYSIESVLIIKPNYCFCSNTTQMGFKIHLLKSD
ncbi:MAG: hypothetical protein A2X12_11635 [Bacteroidetes bacterium GWE2_29_8]|nr:MAG: hypothetical protein A2X12_11635 [Bacteroidetes bacterium GWE2_29_8]OFY24378.1 MAG: hypothetical protein A2X02_08280 [Bacteroidetes bacterium GWF2_29_10]